MSCDVLDHDDRIVDEDADGEDEREQADAVDGVAHQVGGEERDEDGRRNDDEDNYSFAPTDDETHQQHDRECRQPQVKQQLVGLLVRGFAVVARDEHVDILGQQCFSKLAQAMADALGNDDGIGARAFCDGNGDGGNPHELARGILARVPDLMVDLLLADDDGRDIAHIDGPAVACGDEEQSDVRNTVQCAARSDAQALPLISNAPRRKRPVGLAHLVDELAECHPIEAQALRIGLDANLVRPAAHDVGPADVIELGELGEQVLGNVVEVVGLEAIRGFGLGCYCQGNDGDVIDTAADDERLGNADRDAIHVGAYLLMHAQDRVVRVRANEKTRRHQNLVVDRVRVDVLDAVDRLDDRFQRLGDEAHAVLGLEAVGPDRDIDHRHRDLRLFLAR